MAKIVTHTHISLMSVVEKISLFGSKNAFSIKIIIQKSILRKCVNQFYFSTYKLFQYLYYKLFKYNNNLKLLN
jgi:hypothetical protein